MSWTIRPVGTRHHVYDDTGNLIADCRTSAKAMAVVDNLEAGVAASNAARRALCPPRRFVRSETDATLPVARKAQNGAVVASSVVVSAPTPFLQDEVRDLASSGRMRSLNIPVSGLHYDLTVPTRTDYRRALREAEDEVEREIAERARMLAGLSTQTTPVVVSPLDALIPDHIVPEVVAPIIVRRRITLVEVPKPVIRRRIISVPASEPVVRRRLTVGTSPRRRITSVC